MERDGRRHLFETHSYKWSFLSSSVKDPSDSDDNRDSRTSVTQTEVLSNPKISYYLGEAPVLPLVWCLLGRSVYGARCLHQQQTYEGFVGCLRGTPFGDLQKPT